jgi:hypothetical protein
MIVVIDDERTFAENVDHYARTSIEGLGILAKVWSDYVLHYGNKITLYLDHDLGAGDTIRPVVDFLYITGQMGVSTPGLCDLSTIIENIYIHSQNPTTDWIVDVLSPLYKNVRRIPLPELA